MKAASEVKGPAKACWTTTLIILVVYRITRDWLRTCESADLPAFYPLGTFSKVRTRGLSPTRSGLFAIHPQPNALLESPLRRIDARPAKTSSSVWLPWFAEFGQLKELLHLCRTFAT